ncbi:DsrE family protein [bacterium]|jgi:hypothetical protein|nr:DsrE family protein [bacterium]MBT3850478.1 DsrE family protein [bacterium]MBT4434944.1 DsrE family protein [bacterium]
MSKVAIVVLADTATPGDFGRAVNALMTAKEFKEAGDEVKIIFDGAGTKWISKFNEENGKYNSLFDSVRDKVAGVCGYCASAFKVSEDVAKFNINLIDEFDGHPSFKKLVDEGFTVLTF